jgi:MoaA/NifB/PqqE/SkfB family radical SAM enzyme
MKNTNNSSNTERSLLVLTGFSCNNNCIVCSLKDRHKFYPDRMTSDIMKDIAEARKKGFNAVEFTGGEPTIRKDIIELVAYAKKVGFKTIALSTNGRMFSYAPFAKKILDAGLNKVSFSLLGISERMHNGVSRTPGSFKEIIAGIKNVQKNPKVCINISSVISSLNVKNLKKFGLFVLSLGVKNWYLLDLISDGNAKKNYSVLSVKPEILKKEINSLKGLVSRFQGIGFFDFPLCFFDQKLLESDHLIIINAKTRLETSLQVGYNSSRTHADKKGIFQDPYKKHLKICPKCKFYRECGGIGKDYLKAFGSQKFEEMAAQNKCFIRTNAPKEENGTI